MQTIHMHREDNAAADCIIGALIRVRLQRDDVAPQREMNDCNNLLANTNTSPSTAPEATASMRSRTEDRAHLEADEATKQDANEDSAKNPRLQ
jgi:hypothetical protein